MRKSIIFFMIAGVAAMIAALIVYSALRRKDVEVEQAMVKTVNVAAAAHDLVLGAKIDASAIKKIRWPKDTLPAGAITDTQSVIGSIVKAPFVENEPLVTAKLFDGDKSAGVLPLLIPANMRAMSVAVDEVGDIAGFVLPHARVDVLVALAGNSGHQDSRAKIVLENIEVLAVAQTLDQKDQPQVEKVVTLLVTPDEAERLALASREGTLRLAMRNYTDNDIVATAGVDIQKIMGSYANTLPPVALAKAGSQKVIYRPPPQAKPFEIEVMRDGQSRQAVRFGRDGQAIPDAKKGPSASSAPAAPSSEPADAGDEAATPGKPDNSGTATSWNDKSSDGNAGGGASQSDHPDSASLMGAKDAAALAPVGKTIDVP
jgi:pilus assembly protein CpaB